MRTHKYTHWAAILLLLATSTITQASGGDAKQAWHLINNGALLVDVRRPDEFNGGHVPGAKHIPVTEVEKRIAEFGSDKNRPIVVYCQSGGRAGKAETMLRNHGFTHVLNAGGYADLMATKPK